MSKQQTGNMAVMLAVDASSYSDNTVDLAIELTASGSGFLQGIFVEDEDLLYAAGLPCSREIAFHSARERPHDPDRTRQYLQQLASRFRQYLELSAKKVGISWNYDYRGGRLLDICLDSPSEFHFIVLTPANLHAMKRRHHSHNRRILLVEDHSCYLLQALRVVLERYRNQRVDLTLINRTEELDAEASPLRRELNEMIAAESGITLISRPHRDVYDALVRTSVRFDYAIVPRREIVESRRRLILQLRCPVILVN